VSDVPGEGELLEAARGGDPVALEALIARHQARIYRFSMKMCRRPEDAADVLQDTLLAMARSLRDFRGASALSTWLYAIARSFCIKKRRRSKFAPEQELSLEGEAKKTARAIPDARPAADELVADAELAQALRVAISAIQPAYREVLVLRDVEGLSAREVAQVMDLSVQAVKSRLHRARGMLRERLAPLLETPLPARPARCPDVAALLSQHLEGDLTPDTCASLERHLAECGYCDSVCQSLKRNLGLCKAATEPDVPAEVQERVKAAIRSLLRGGEPNGRESALTSRRHVS
jgi:RNA polymerase sigma-70 factor, ECF subfamily